MNNLIVYVDDAAHALHILQPLLAEEQVPGQTRWLVVGCAPRVTHHVSKWVTHSARDAWRRRWADKVFGPLVPMLLRDGDEVITMLAESTLVTQTESLIRAHGAARVLDARRPRFGQDMQPVTAMQEPGHHLVV